MRTFKKMTALALPLAATLAAASFASADDVIAYWEGVGAGQAALNCDVSINGLRALVASEATAESRDSLDPITVGLVYESGTSVAEPVGRGIRHKARLVSEAMDHRTAEMFVVEHCETDWTSGFVSNGTTNVAKCSRSINSSLTANGSCRKRTFTAYSMGVDN